MSTTTTAIRYDNATPKQRDYIAGKLDHDLGVCQSALVGILLERAIVDGDDIRWQAPNPFDWTLDECREYADDQGIELPNPDDYDTPDEYLHECQITIRDEAAPPEVMEWWLITNSAAADDLEHMGEPVLRTDYGDWWGRTCTGQAITQDPTWWIMYQDGVTRYAV